MPPFLQESDYRLFLKESLAIEGINREPTKDELFYTGRFLIRRRIDLIDVCALQMVYAPHMPLREQIGMDVRVGNYIAPAGGQDIKSQLEGLLANINLFAGPFEMHILFEALHPFMDGNGRTGRAIWAWQMLHIGRNPFRRTFLHEFYYQALQTYAK